MNAIPTKYAGVQFRSRLEAKWAVFFDACGWKWEYEPYDLDGWIPDFALFGVQEIVVEVKPFAKLGEFDLVKMEAALATSPKAQCDLLLLGPIVLTEFEDRPNWPTIGWLGEWLPEADSRAWARANLVCLNRYPPTNVDIAHDEQSFRYRLTGFYDGNTYHVPPQIAEQWWRDASNRVQWKAPRSQALGIPIAEWTNEELLRIVSGSEPAIAVELRARLQSFEAEVERLRRHLLEERERCMALICASCADGHPIEPGAPGQWWHRAGSLSLVCRASRIRSAEIVVKP